MNDQIEIKDLDQEVPVQADWLVFQKVSDGVVYKAPKSDIEGEDAFVYIAYADDDIGTGFTLTFDANKNYIAIKSTNTEIANPVVGDFAGLWKNYKGQKGDNGVAATVTAGTTTTLAAGQNAKVTNVGTTSAAVFKFEIPKGDKGDDGAKIVTAEFVGNDIHFNLDDGTEAILVGAKTDLKGATGDTGASVVDAEVSGDDIVFTKSDGSTITIENILIELKGETGNGIATIEKTDTTGLVDTYTITYDDETTKTFTVTNGAKGDTGDNATVDVGTTTTGDAGTEASVVNVGTTSDAIFNFTIPKGDKGDTGNGISDISKTGTSGLTDTYTITFTDETTTTFDVVNGENGDNAYVYIAYASDDTGTDFTTTFNPLLNYIAIKTTTTAIVTPQASDFTGLWKNYKGEKGDTGDMGVDWQGAWSAGTYTITQAVSHNGSSWICTATSTTEEPSISATDWSLMAQKGADGEGAGDVIGPASATDKGVALFDTTTGKLLKNSTSFVQLDNGNVGIGTTTPQAKLDISAGNLDLDNTTNANQFGVISKNGTRFIHDFNCGDNGTVTTVGRNTFVGLNAGNLTMGSTATQNYHSSYNTGIGYQSLQANTIGYYNSALGFASLYSNTTGYYNSALGVQSLYSNTTGYYNSALGYRSLYSNTTGNNNSALGYRSLYSNTTGAGNSALGMQSLSYNTTGYYNSALGYRSLYSNTTGAGNSALGLNAGRYISDGTTGRTTGNYGLYLGYDTKASADETDNEIVIGANATGNGSNTATYGNTSMTKHIFKAGNVGIGTTSPTAVLHLKAGTATAGTAPLKLTSGVVNTTPEAGAIEFDGTDLFITI